MAREFIQRQPHFCFSTCPASRGAFSSRSNQLKAISDVVAELVHAANIAAKLTDSEKLMLLTRAYITIQEGGEAFGEVEATADSDVAVDIITSTGMVAQLSDEEFKTLLLEAADQIRDIKIALDRKRARLSAP